MAASGLARLLMGLGCCLAIVAWFAEGLPVVRVPKEILVAAMRCDVVDYRGCDVSIGLGTRHAKRMRAEVANACIPPTSIVASLGCVGSIESLDAGLVWPLAAKLLGSGCSLWH